MLVLLLFDGGMHIGWRRFRAAAGAVLWIGVVGHARHRGRRGRCSRTSSSASTGAPALLLGVALAPTDPAVVFSVLGRREVGGRSGTLLEGESGANDPVGIAAMAALLAAGGAAAAGTPWVRGRASSPCRWCVGAAVGAAGGYLLSLLMRRMPLPNGALYPLQTLLGAGADLRRWPPPPTAPASWPSSSPASWSATCARRTRARSTGSTARWPASARSSRSPCSA